MFNIPDRLSELEQHNIHEHIRTKDPISIVRRYSDKTDRELVGFIVSCLSYGRQDQFMPKVKEILEKFGSYPYETLLRFDPSYWNFDWKYRFHDGNDIVNLCWGISQILRKYHSIENMISDRPVKEGISRISKFLRLDVSYPRRVGRLFSMFPDPDQGSACKRMNMYFRWMVRDEWPDCGVWNSVDKSALYMPVDTHVFRITNRLFFEDKYKRPNWDYVEVLTERLRNIYPDDPTKFDVVMCNAGVLGLL